jgi:hypothetical protein
MSEQKNMQVLSFRLDRNLFFINHIVYKRIPDPEKRDRQAGMMFLWD